MHGRHIAVASTVAAALVVVFTTPASAGGNVVFRDQIVGSDSHIEQVAHAPDWCPEVPFDVLWEGRFVVRDTARERGTGDELFFSFHVTDSSTWTNVETGASFAQRTTFNGGDQDVSLDGDILTVNAKDRFSTMLFDQDGRMVAHDAGLVKFTFIVDLNDIENPDDDEFLSESVMADHGLRAFGERDFCQDVLTFLG